MLFDQVANLNREGNASFATSTVNLTNDVLDAEVLKSFERVKSNDNSDIVIELIELYLQSTPERIQTIRKAAAENEWDVLKRAAHTVKGSSSTLGLRTLAKVCQALEARSWSCSDSIDDLVEAVESQFVEAREALLAERKRRQYRSIHRTK